MPTTRNTNNWAHPSLSRDFALLSATIVFVMVLISAWVTWITYVKHSERVLEELNKEAVRIESTMESEVLRAGMLLQAIGRQVALKDTADVRRIAQLLLTFSSGNSIYALLNWSDTDMKIVASSRDGVLETPVDVSDRDYIQRAKQEPGMLHIGSPVEGRVSQRWIIPVSYGITDDTGRFLGTVAASIDISALSTQISHLVHREGISYAVLSKAFLPLTVVSDNEEFAINQLPMQSMDGLNLEQRSTGVISRARPFIAGGMYASYLVSGKYPYIIIVGYDNRVSDEAIRAQLWPRLMQIIVVAGFLLVFLGLIRSRVIKPVVELSEITNDVISGKRYRSLSKAGPLEIEQLSAHIGRVDDYLTERRMVEDELRHKIIELQQRVKHGKMDSAQRAAILAALLGEYKKSLRSINSMAQVMKDQLYGPIENKKYKQYAVDIHQAGVTLELMVRKLIALARADGSAVLPRQEALHWRHVLESAERYCNEGEANLLALSHTPSSWMDMPFLADPLQMQQAISYLFYFLMGGEKENKEDNTPFSISTAALGMALGKNEVGVCILIAPGAGAKDITPQEAQHAFANEAEWAHAMPAEPEALGYLHFALAKKLLEVQGLTLSLLPHPTLGRCVLVFVPPARLVEKELA